jgi:hypothetical protein
MKLSKIQESLRGVTPGVNFLHTHPGKEINLKLPKDHVIVDRADLDKTIDILNAIKELSIKTQAEILDKSGYPTTAEQAQDLIEETLVQQLFHVGEHDKDDISGSPLEFVILINFLHQYPKILNFYSMDFMVNYINSSR